MLSILGGKNGCWDGCFEAGQRPLAFWSAQVPGQEAKIVNRQDPSVNGLLLLHQDAGNFLWELDEGLQINQFLADPSWTWRKGTGIGHRDAWLAFWKKKKKRKKEKSNKSHGYAKVGIPCNRCLLNISTPHSWSLHPVKLFSHRKSLQILWDFTRSQFWGFLSQNPRGSSTKVSAWWIVLYYLSYYGDCSDICPACPLLILRGRVGLVFHCRSRSVPVHHF